jgi:prophage regulatory protein
MVHGLQMGPGPSVLELRLSSTCSLRRAVLQATFLNDLLVNGVRKHLLTAFSEMHVAAARPRPRPGPFRTGGSSGGLVNTRITSTPPSPVTVGPPRILRVQQVQDRTGLSRTTIWRLERTNQFPKHCRISARAIGWRESDVTRWIEDRPAATL